MVAISVFRVNVVSFECIKVCVFLMVMQDLHSVVDGATEMGVIN